MSEYYIVCKRHMKTKDFAFLFWCPDHNGYTYCIDKAGIYSQEEVDKHFQNHKNDMPVLKEPVLEKSNYYIIDNQMFGKALQNTSSNRKFFNTKLKELLKFESAWDGRCFVTPNNFMRRNENTEALLNEAKNFIKNSS